MKKLGTEKGFTLVELLVVVLILTVVLTGMLQLFIFTRSLAELAGGKTAAVAEAQSKIEELREQTYDDIETNYAYGTASVNPFPLSELDGFGYIYFDHPIHNDLLEIEVVICWRTSNGRVIGSDQNLDGNVDSGEAPNGDGRFVSEVSLLTMLAKR